MNRRLLTLAAGLALGCSTAQSADPVPSPRTGTPPEEEAAGEVRAPAPPLTAAQRAALRVRTISVEPAELLLQVGETRTVEVVPRDEAGEAVEGVQLRTFVRSRAAVYDPATDEIRALEPGEGTLFAFISKPAPEGERPELISARMAIKVTPLPVARIEVIPPAGPVYAGVRYRMEAAAHSEQRRREDVRFQWSSSAPDVGHVSELGFLVTGRPGTATLTARAEGVEASGEVTVRPNPIRAVVVEPGTQSLLTGEVAHFSATARDETGREVEVPIAWTAAGVSGQLVESDYVDEQGRFVASLPGDYLVTVTVGSLSGTAEVGVTARPARRTVEEISHGAVSDHSTSDLWVFEGRDGRDYAYTGTHSAGAGGNVLFAWDVTDPASPVITDSVVVDARVVNDVKVNADRTLAVITREGASNRRNGIVILDIRDPAHPSILSEYTETVTGGVHNVWIEGDYVYAVHDGTSAVHIIDISDPLNPFEAGRWEIDSETKLLHDVMVKDGLAYISYWDDGLIVLDVGAGIKGGTPTEPALVSQITTRVQEGGEVFGNTHHAIRYKNYVFLGDEIFGCRECVNGPRGYVHVIDVTDLENPQEVAWFRVPEAGTHNLWVEDDKLYIAYYQGGLRIVDVSGELRGDLYRQGREIGWFLTEDDEGISPHAAMAWGPQPYKGLIFVADMNSGLWVVRLEEPEEVLVP